MGVGEFMKGGVDLFPSLEYSKSVEILEGAKVPEEIGVQEVSIVESKL